MRLRCPPIRPRIEDGQDEVDAPAEELTERRAFELRGAELRLKVPQPPFDLEQKNRDAVAEHEIRCTKVGSRSHWDLEALAPRAVGLAGDPPSDTQLPAIPQSNAISRNDLEDEPMTGSTSESTREIKMERATARHEPAHARSAEAHSVGQFALCQPGDVACETQLTTKPVRCLVARRSPALTHPLMMP
jgi:hypothetical protein